eukprot:TRINITY_DN5902_c0_g1_i1.p1 TRINITY_DN5902_c0_g1~~TRINITY_DN5902_c0_g1_i1.p1  ORF type:complete len:269 (-),score=37.81 TRINITY_DN5902_c0_g1_i1:284-1090(-)
MGAKKLKWTEEEEKALRLGVEQYGAGKWRTILKDPVLGAVLAARSNVDLKDKWRNVSVSAIFGLSPRDKKIKKSCSSNGNSSADALVIDASSSCSPATATNAETSCIQAQTQGQANLNLSKKYEDLILEALRVLQGTPNGSDTSAIVNFMKARQELPPHFKRLLRLKLKELTSKGVVEKSGNNYLLKDPNFVSGAVEELDVSHRERVQEASMVAARKMAEAEAVSALASEATRESEHAASLAEESDMLIQVYSSLYDHLLGDGSVLVC